MDELTRKSPTDARPVSLPIRVRDALREFAYGMTSYEFARHAVESRVAIENLFLYVVPEIATWKRRVLREREFTDEHEHHLHGV